MRRIAVLAALCALAGATTTEEVDVKCPVCENGFKAEQWNSTNNVGGVDRDFLEHAAGGQVFLIVCWTCPRCAYTGFPPDFDADEAPKELVARLKKENPLKPAVPIDPKVVRSGDIPGWVRYDLRIQVLGLMPATTASQLANACLRAAHTQRFEWEILEGNAFDKRYGALYKKAWDALPEGKKGRGVNAFDSHVAMARALEAEAADPKAAAEARRDARVAAAFLYKTRGEDPDALRVLGLLAAEELPADLEAVVADIRVRIERERKYRRLAIAHFEKHLAEGKPEEDEATALRYLVGVLYRHTGDPKKALANLEPLLAAEGIPDGFKEWIEDEVAKAKAG